jgi:hypothetical protein
MLSKRFGASSNRSSPSKSDSSREPLGGCAGGLGCALHFGFLLLLPILGKPIDGGKLVSWSRAVPSGALGIVFGRVGKLDHDKVLVSIDITAWLNALLPLSWMYLRCASSRRTADPENSCRLRRENMAKAVRGDPPVRVALQ